MHEPPLILVVDDQESGRFVKMQTLRRAGFDVRTAETGQEALAQAAALTPDVIILDVNLPDINGVEVCARLRATQAEPPYQILQISSTAVSPADRVRGLEHGADVYMTEPLHSEVLVASVQAHLRVRRAEEALADALQRERTARAAAEEANRLKDEFLATLSHELRTPLNAVMGWIWQLRHSTLDERTQHRALDSLERNAKLQAQLINDLLDISRISKGKLHLRMQLVDLRTVIDDAMDAVREAAEGKHLTVAITAAPGVIVTGDQARLQQVVANLLTNAVQFTPADGRIDISLMTDDGIARLQVRDTGVGIDPAFLPYVFDQFRQGKGGLSRKHFGLGLGLTVVRQLMELHGGAVEVTSDGVGQGTTFTLTIPAEPVDTVGADPEAPLLDGLCVLVVHHDAQELAAILEASGAQTHAVELPSAAAEVLRMNAVDVVLSDTAPEDQGSRGVPVVPVGSGWSAGQLVRSVRAVHPRDPAVRR
jgi:signal transduction histidine kinase